MVGPDLPTWSHDSVWLFPTTSTPAFNTAFVRFDWSSIFRTITGVTNSPNILNASFTLLPAFGDSQTIQLRRCLQRWSDPVTGGDFNSNPTGAPTWNSSAHGTKAWTVAGAGRLGSNGTSTNEYFGTNDLATRVDASVAMSAINEPVELSGALVTDAFRFWFDNASVDYGYALRLAGGAQESKFSRWEEGLRDQGPVLQLTYLLPGALPRLTAFANGASTRVHWPIEHIGYSIESTTGITDGWMPYVAVISTNATQFFFDVSTSASPRFFRLVK